MGRLIGWPHPFLSPQAPKLPVRENDVGQVFVANLSSIPVQDVSEFNKLYTYAYFSTRMVRA